MDIPGQKQISAYAGRGILSESCGPVWMIGTGTSPNISHLYMYILTLRQLVSASSFHFSRSGSHNQQSGAPCAIPVSFGECGESLHGFDSD